MTSAGVDAASPKSLELRRVMVDRQVRTFDVTDQIVIGRMIEVPREPFVEAAQRQIAHSDLALDLAGSGGPKARSLLPPFVIARMLQAAAPMPGESALDVAGGSGYTAALLAGLVGEVVALESDEALSKRAADNAAALGLSNVRTVCAPLENAAGAKGRFDLVVVNGAIEANFEALLASMKPGGRMIAIVVQPSGALQAARLQGKAGDPSIRPLFDARAPVLAAFRRAPAFAL